MFLRINCTGDNHRGTDHQLFLSIFLQIACSHDIEQYSPTPYPHSRGGLHMLTDTTHSGQQDQHVRSVGVLLNHKK